MKRSGFRERIRYAFDNYMGKGTIALIFMLFLITAVVVIITGVMSCIGNADASAGNMIWMSLMHAIDAGTLAGDDTSHTGYVILMAVVTICGIFVTSILIGIISSGFEEKLNSLRKGFSRVIENNHTVIIGFNDSIYTIITELIEANSNHRNGRILVIGSEDKEIMDEEIRNHIDDFKTTKVICRSGNQVHSAVLDMSSVETARSIIINEEDDFVVIKTILSVVSYLKSKNAFENKAYITAIIHDSGNLEAARIAGEGKAEIIYFKDMIARVIANTCRQPGMSSVLTEIFGFAGDEFYFEEFPELKGKKFGDILNLFRVSTVVGICRGDDPMLNPPMDTVIEEGDRIIHLAEDDGVSKPSEEQPVIKADGKKAVDKYIEDNEFELLILGHNDSLPLILNELDDFMTKGSKVTVACDSLPENADTACSGYSNLDMSWIEKNIYERRVLEEILKKDVRNILLLSDGDDEGKDADSRSLLLLLQIRAIAAAKGIEFNITSEMDSVDNQNLLRVANVNDFVVGSKITNLMLTQISENRELTSFFTTLLTADGSELYMKSVRKYIRTGTEMDFFELTDIVKAHNEIFFGYKKTIDGTIKIVINPDKSQKITFNKDDHLIVIAEDQF